MRQTYLFIATVIALSWGSGASAFRNCETADSSGFSASTKYTVGEVDFDEVTGLASGTETTYNYSNEHYDSFVECHVTYELDGNYVSGGGVFVLDATRTNHSASCPTDFLEINYPDNVLHSLQVEFDEGGQAVVKNAASAEFFAYGSWASGTAVYKTDEKCTEY